MIKYYLLINEFNSNFNLGAKKEGLVSMTKGIIKNEGFFVLYTGLGATYLKVIPSTALAFAINERCKKFFGVESVH